MSSVSKATKQSGELWSCPISAHTWITENMWTELHTRVGFSVSVIASFSGHRSGLCCRTLQTVDLMS